MVGPGTRLERSLAGGSVRRAPRRATGWKADVERTARPSGSNAEKPWRRGGPRLRTAELKAGHAVVPGTRRDGRPRYAARISCGSRCGAAGRRRVELSVKGARGLEAVCRA